MLQKQFKNRQEWREWLKNNHDKESEIWLVFDKVKYKKPSLKYNDAVEEALCFGWIDSTVRRIDDEKHQQRFTPRKANSNWSQSNKKRVKRLIKAGLMTKSGMRSIEMAKKNDSWKRLDSIELYIEIPQALEDHFKTNPKAKELFKKLPPSRRKQICWWIASAKRKETIEKRLKETVDIIISEGKKR